MKDPSQPAPSPRQTVLETCRSAWGNAAHLDEIDVHPNHGRRGLGRRLMAEVCSWAQEREFPPVTLTTFRDVPWIMPFYAGLGFEEIPSGALTPR